MKESSSSQQRSWIRYSGMGIEFAAGVVGCVLLGVFLDRRYGWAPWGVLVGAIVGTVGSMVNLIRQAMAMIRSDERRRRGESGQHEE